MEGVLCISKCGVLHKCGMPCEASVRVLDDSYLRVASSIYKDSIL
jgi:hypothetical protein